MSVHGDTDWGDYDNDGDLDLIVSGYVGYVNGTNTFSTKLYQNLGNSVFEDTQFNFTPPTDNVRVVWGDYDNDQDLDLLISNCGNNIVKIYRNDSTIANSNPLPPVMSIDYESGMITMQGSDDLTNADGLTYDLKIGTNSGGFDVHCPPADLTSGKRKLTEFGLKSYKLPWPPTESHFISSQSIDNNYQGSVFSGEIQIQPLPLINLVSQPQLEFGTAHIGYSTTEQQAIIHNWGSAPLVITDLSFMDSLSSFTVNCALPVVVPINGDFTIPIIFSPIEYGNINDSLFIHSDALNQPIVTIGLHGIGQYAPLSVVENLTISHTSNSIVLEWDPITTSIYGTPIAPDGYVILSSQDPSVCEEDFNFISYVNDSCFTHFGVNLFYGSMFYVVKGIKFDRSVNHNSVKDLLNSVPVSKWKQVKTFIESFNHGVVSN